MERNRIVERTAVGRDKAKAEGKHMGRPASIAGERAAQALRALVAPEAKVAHVAEEFGISRQALLRLRNSDAKHAQEARHIAGQ